MRLVTSLLGHWSVGRIPGITRSDSKWVIAWPEQRWHIKWGFRFQKRWVKNPDASQIMQNVSIPIVKIKILDKLLPVGNVWECGTVKQCQQALPLWRDYFQKKRRSLAYLLCCSGMESFIHFGKVQFNLESSRYLSCQSKFNRTLRILLLFVMATRRGLISVRPDLDSVISLRVPIMDHGTEWLCFQIAWCDTLTSALEQFCSQPCRDSLALLSIVPKIIWLKIDRVEGGEQSAKGFTRAWSGWKSFQTLSGRNSGDKAAAAKMQTRATPCQPAQCQWISAGAVCCALCGPRAFLTVSMRQHLKWRRSCAICTPTAHNLPSFRPKTYGLGQGH